MTDMMTDTPSAYPCLDGLYFGTVSNDLGGAFWRVKVKKFRAKISRRRINWVNNAK